MEEEEATGKEKQDAPSAKKAMRMHSEAGDRIGQEVTGGYGLWVGVL